MPGILDREAEWEGGGGGGAPWGGSEGGPGADFADPTVAETGTLQILLSEGPVEGLVDGLKSVYLDGTPIENADGSHNFKGIALALVAGTNTQASIEGITGTESETAVGVQVVQATPVVRTISTNPSAVRVRISIPALKVISTTDGKSSGNSVTVKIERKHAVVTGGAWEVVTLQGGGVITGGPFSTKFTRSYRIETPATGSWDIRVTRVSADDADAYHLSQTWWEAYTEIVDARLRYPNSSVLSIRVNAKQFRSIPQVNVLMKGVKVDVPKNYDPATRVYATTGPGTSGGAWDGTFKEAWTDNPAWTFYAAAVKTRWGAGTFLNASGLDKWTLYNIAQWADTLVDDGHGGTEPRMTCNLYIQAPQNAIKALGQLASIFWAVLYYASGLVVPVPDSDDAPVALFTNANVEGGKFTYEGTARQARHTAAIVKFNNPDLAYSSDAAVYEDEAGIARYGYNPLDLQGIGCTSQGQALRLAKWAILSELMAPETVAFTSGLEGSTLKPGDVVQVADQFRAGNTRAGGRVLDPDAVNLIPNGDSEDYLPTGYAAVAVDPAAYFTGTKGRSVVGDGTAAIYNLTSDIPCVPGDQFYLETMRARIGSGGGHAYLSMVWVNSSGVGFAAVDLDLSAATPEPWAQWSTTGTAPAGTAFVRFRLQKDAALPAGNYAYFDNLYARKVASLTTVHLDAPVTLAAGTYTLRVQTATGMESRTVTTGVGTTSVLTVGSAFSSAPMEGAGWLLQKNSEASLWRLLSVKKGEGLKHELIALKHDPAKYTALGLAAGDVVTRTPRTITAPTPAGLAITSVSRILNDRQQLTLQADWTLDGAVGYTAQASRDYGPWQDMVVAGASASLDAIQPGAWRVRVAGDWRNAGLSPWANASATITAPSTQPAWVAAAAAAAAYADGLARQFNLIKNGNSEAANPTGYEAALVSSAAYYNGTKGRAVIGDGTGAVDYLTPPIPCIPGDQFYMEAMAARIGSGGGHVYFSMVWINASGTAFSGDDIDLSAATPGPWMKVSKSATAPSGACFVAFRLQKDAALPAGDYAYFDELYACRKISAGMLEALLAIVGEIQSFNYVAGTSSTPATGFWLSGTAATKTALGGATYSVQFELGTSALFGGYLVGDVANRVQPVNRIMNGSFYKSLESWGTGGTYPPTYSSSTKTAGTGSAVQTYAGTSYSRSGEMTQSFSIPKLFTGQTATLSFQTGFATTRSTTDACTVDVYILNQSTGTETLLGTYTYTNSSMALAWTARSVNVTSYVANGGDFSLRFVLTISDSSVSVQTTSLHVDEISLPI